MEYSVLIEGDILIFILAIVYCIVRGPRSYHGAVIEI